MTKFSPYGLLPQPFDPRDLWEDELLGGTAEEALPASYKNPQIGAFEPQGAWPFCVAFSVTGMLEGAIRKAQGIVLQLSQPHLFFNAGGGPNGTYFRAALDVAVKKGCISAGAFPMPAQLWDTEAFDGFKRAALAQPFVNPKKALGYVRINPTAEAIKRAILKYGQVMVGVVASGGYWNADKLRPAGRDENHATRLFGWDDREGKRGVFYAIDSLQPKANFDGVHTFSQDYEFFSIYALTELPADWKEQQAASRAKYQTALDHYGKPRNLEAEQRASLALLDAFRRLTDKLTLDSAGPLWTVYVNAVAYGGYSVSYRKLLREMPGDIINDAYSRRVNGREVFDFNRLRSTYP